MRSLKIQGWVDSAPSYIITSKAKGSFLGTSNIWLAGGNAVNRDRILGISLFLEYWNKGTEVRHWCLWWNMHSVGWGCIGISLGVFKQSWGHCVVTESV
jgi:hypothetical protein